MDKEKLKQILELHRLYLIADPNGVRADLRYADLSSADLRYADLSSADLRYANLRYADLRYADLRYANLRSADLSSANLRYADLRYADLRYANLSSADLSSADLSSADLSSANLRYADLRYADLRYAENIPSLVVSQYQKDLLYVLMHCKNEVPFLKEKILAGKINGTQYEGECACLIGTLANGDGGLKKLCGMIPFYEKGLHNFSEQLFFQIKVGDKPETNQFSKIALETIEYFEKNYAN